MSNHNTISGNYQPTPEYFWQEFVPEQGSCRKLDTYQLVHTGVDGKRASASIGVGEFDPKVQMP